MHTTTSVLLAVVGMTALAGAPARGATLLGQTMNADITIAGTDDNGSYAISVYNGSISVGGGFFDDIPVFKQLTQDGFSTPSNTIDGDVAIQITSDSVSVTMNGQVQPFELESQFTGIGVGDPLGAIVGDVGSTSGDPGLQPGVNMVLFDNFGQHSLDFATFYLGYQPGTNLAQTETLTFGAASSVPEPSAWAMMVFGFLGIGYVGLRRRTKDRVSLAWE